MKRLAVVVAVLVLVLMWSCMVSADMKVSMKVGENLEHKAVISYVVNIYSEKRECDDIYITFLVTDPKGDIKYIDQVSFSKTSVSTNYTDYSQIFNIAMSDNDPTGLYTVKSRYMQNDKYIVETKTFNYLSKKDREMYINMFNKDPVDATEIRNALTRYRTSFINLGFLYNMYSKYIQNNPVLFELFIDTLNSSRPLTRYNEKSLPETFNALSILIPVNNSDIEDFVEMVEHANMMLDYEIIPIDSELYDLGDSVKNDIYLKVYNSIPFNSVDDIKKAFDERLLELKPKPPSPDNKDNTANANNGGPGKMSGTEITKNIIEEETNKGKTEIESKTKQVFPDVSLEHWAYEAISELYGLGIINGRGDGIFAPNDNITREEFVKMIVGALAYDITENPVEFKDVENSAWYFPYISTAYYNALIYGRSLEIFGVGEYITRQDVVVILYRALEMLLDLELSENVPIDINEASDYAMSSIQSLYNYGIIQGYEDGTFRPLQNITRAEVAAIIYRIVSK